MDRFLHLWPRSPCVVSHTTIHLAHFYLPFTFADDDNNDSGSLLYVVAIYLTVHIARETATAWNIFIMRSASKKVWRGDTLFTRRSLAIAPSSC